VVKELPAKPANSGLANMTENLRGKSALVTGGTDGVGKEIARSLAKRGARLIIVGRDSAKGARAKREIRVFANSRDVDFLQADLSLVREAHRVGDEVAGRWSTMNYLVHSAGIVRGRRVVTFEGVESNFATNYLSRFVLTNRLLPTLRAAGRPGESARIVIIAAPGLSGRIHYDDVNLSRSFSTIRALKQFQHANNIYTAELARRLALSGDHSQITISCFNPGPTKTNIHTEFPLWMRLLVQLVFNPVFARTPELPAAAALELLLSKVHEGESGALFALIRKFKRLDPPPSVRNPDEGRRLWEFTEQLATRAMARTETTVAATASLSAKT